MKALGYSAEEKSWFFLSDFPELTFYWAKIEKKISKIHSMSDGKRCYGETQISAEE